jgi:hypothetical protein
MLMPQGTIRRAGDSTEMRVNATSVRMISSNCAANRGPGTVGTSGTSGTPGAVGTSGTSEPTLPNDGTGRVPEKKY